jgi:hypothetical protein
MRWTRLEDDGISGVIELNDGKLSDGAIRFPISGYRVGNTLKLRSEEGRIFGELECEGKRRFGKLMHDTYPLAVDGEWKKESRGFVLRCDVRNVSA